MGFKEAEGKPEYPEKNLAEQGREPATNSTHILGHHLRDSNPGHIGGRVCSHHCTTIASQVVWH